MDGGAWWAAVHGVAKSQTRLSNFTFTFMHWRRKWQPTPVFLPGKSHGWWSLVGYRPWGRKESDTTERLHFHFLSLGVYLGPSLGSQEVKCLPATWRPEFVLWVGTIPWSRKWQPTPVFLPGESPRTEEPGGLQSLGSQRVRHGWVIKHAHNRLQVLHGHVIHFTL